MIETTPSLQPAALHARLAQAAICLARQRAIAAVKRQIQAEGRRKLSQIAHCEIVVLAKEYLAAHPELIDEAKPIVEQWAAEGFLGKRAARELERNSQVTNRQRRPAAQGLLVCESHERNGGPQQ
jgi:hypothetical protein